MRWRHPHLVSGDTGGYGQGVFAGAAIHKGDVLHVLDGAKVSVGELVARTLRGEEGCDDPLQVGRRTYLDLDNASRLFNHGCDPTAGLRKTCELFALRDIRAGEQITFDYSMTVAPTDWTMPCACGARRCRKTIGDVRTVPARQRRAYEQAGAVQRYMRAVLRELDAGTYRIPRYEVLAMQRINAALGKTR